LGLFIKFYYHLEYTTWEIKHIVIHGWYYLLLEELSLLFICLFFKKIEHWLILINESKCLDQVWECNNLVCTFWKIKCSISFEVEKSNIEWLLMGDNDYSLVVMTTKCIFDGKILIYSTCFVLELIYLIFVWYTIYRKSVTA